jgi:hypothetical protein
MKVGGIVDKGVRFRRIRERRIGYVEVIKK